MDLFYKSNFNDFFFITFLFHFLKDKIFIVKYKKSLKNVTFTSKNDNMGKCKTI